MDAFRSELLEQPAALTATAAAVTADEPILDELTARVERDHLDHVVITGVGGSYYAAIPLWLRLAAAGRPATLIDTADAYGPEVNERLIAGTLHPYPEEIDDQRAAANIRKPCRAELV